MEILEIQFNNGPRLTKFAKIRQHISYYNYYTTLSVATWIFYCFQVGGRFDIHIFRNVNASGPEPTPTRSTAPTGNHGSATGLTL